MNAARKLVLGTFTVFALSVACLLALSIAVAQAEPPKLIFEGTISTSGLLPDGVAIDQSSGDVYVASFANQSFSAAGHIDKFDAAGKLLAPPSSFGEGLRSGTAINPTNGDVYAINPETSSIETFDSSSGVLVGTPFAVPASANFSGLTLIQIATDSAGNVYVPVVPGNEVLEYSSSGVLLYTFTGSGAGALKEPTGVAVDSSGDVWVADHGDNRIEELNSSGAFVGEIKSEGVTSVALDAHGDVFATVNNSVDSCGSLERPCSHLVEYSSAGAQIADVGAGDLEAFGGIILPSMVAVNKPSGRVYVTDSDQGLVWVFGPPTAPVLGTELTAEIGTSEAKLGALVNPGGIGTTYRFEYGTEAGVYGHTTPFAEGSVGEGLESHAVWASASGLQPGTTYHYRVVATNELAPGGVVGPDQTFTTLTAEQAACPNEQLRGGFSARLPDCRAYELVTPSTKTSVQVRGVEMTAADGNAISFITHEPLPDAPTGGNYYVTTRAATGWTSEDIMPLESYTGILCVTGSSNVPAYSDELSKAIVSYGFQARASQGVYNDEACNADGLQVVPGEPVGYQNLLLRDNATGSYRLINALPLGVTPADGHFQAASADLSRVVFTETSPLAEGGRYGAENLYEWDEGVLRLVSVLPHGAPTAGTLPQANPGANVISSDGSHVLFTSAGGLYDRIDGEQTVEVDEAREGLGGSGGGAFQAASANGQEVYFTDESRLTSDSTAASGKPDLYECVLPEGASKCELADLTVATGGEHADVLRVSVLGSQDSGHVYFTARGALASNTREYTDSEGNTILEKAESGQNNLYVWRDGTTAFIATLKPTGEDFGGGQASPDGTWFAFDSHKNLTGYDNTEPDGEPAQEIFLYDASSTQLVCASCNPSGEAPANGNGGATVRTGLRALSDSGRLFFETSEALVPSDTNGQVDVYEYEDGQPSLISGGTSSSESQFVGASESGDDVFFVSHQALVPQDTGEEGSVIYDARVDGGFSAPITPPPCTTADSCRTAASSQPSIYGAPSSQTFSGPGNLAPPPPPVKTTVKKVTKCKKGFTKNKKDRCVGKKTKKPKKSKKAKKTSNDQRAK